MRLINISPLKYLITWIIMEYTYFYQLTVYYMITDINETISSSFRFIVHKDSVYLFTKLVFTELQVY